MVWLTRMQFLISGMGDSKWLETRSGIVGRQPKDHFGGTDPVVPAASGWLVELQSWAGLGSFKASMYCTPATALQQFPSLAVHTKAYKTLWLNQGRHWSYCWCTANRIQTWCGGSLFLISLYGPSMQDVLFFLLFCTHVLHWPPVWEPFVLNKCLLLFRMRNSSGVLVSL